MMKNVTLPAELIPGDPRFGCGPSLIVMDDLTTLQRQGVHLLGTSHRKEPVIALCRDIQEGLRRYFSLPDDYSVILGNGGATVLFDMIGLGLVKKNITHFVCGEFSDKWYKASHRIPWINAEKQSAPLGTANVVIAPKHADVIACTLNETSTGVMLQALPDVGPECLLAVDATSGAGQIPCDISRVDVFFFSPQKVFASEGGLYIAILSPKARRRVDEISANDERYIPAFLDWRQALSYSDKHQTYNTPAITPLFLLAEQIKRMNVPGFANVVALAQEKARLVYDWAEQKAYLSPYVKDPKSRSITVATIDVDERFPIAEMLAYLDYEGIAHGIEGYRNLNRNQLRIALFYNISINDLAKLTQLISFIIENRN